MAYTNVHIEDEMNGRKREKMMEAELDFWRKAAEELQRKLENIPRAVREHGHVDIIDRSDTLTLIVKPDDSSEPKP